MSVHAIASALDADAPSTTAKLVLLILANYADGSGVCWPSANLVAAQAGCDERTVRRQLDALEEAGLLTRTRLRRRDGSLSVYRYRLQLGLMRDPEEPLSSEDHRTSVSAGPPDTGVRARTVKSEPSGSTTTDADGGGAVGDGSPNGFPTRLADPVPYWRRVVEWVREHDDPRMLDAVRDRAEGFTVLAGLVTQHIDPGVKRDGAHVQLAVEYLEEMSGEEVTPAVRGHVARLVKGAGPAYALRYLSEALAWGAGLPDDDGVSQGRPGNAGVVRYAVAVWSRERREG